MEKNNEANILFPETMEKNNGANILFPETMEENNRANILFPETMEKNNVANILFPKTMEKNNGVNILFSETMEKNFRIKNLSNNIECYKTFITFTPKKKMEKDFSKTHPRNIFRTALNEAERLALYCNSETIPNYTSGNEFIDELAQQMNQYMMRQSGFYEHAMNLGSHVLHKMMLSITGLTFNEWRNAYILLAANELLACTNHTLDVIGKRLGFASSKSFSIWYIRITKTTPFAMRKILKADRQKKEEELLMQWKKEYYK